jgi:hypothetical protein
LLATVCHRSRPPFSVSAAGCVPSSPQTHRGSVRLDPRIFASDIIGSPTFQVLRGMIRNRA